MKKSIGILLALLMTLPIQTDDAFANLTQNELNIYKKIAKEKCLNILIGNTDHGIIYNGIPIEEPNESEPSYFSLNNGHVAADRLAYMDLTFRPHHVIADGKDLGSISSASGSNGTWEYLYLDTKRVAFFKAVKNKKRYPDRSDSPLDTIFHLIVNGKSFGEVYPTPIKINNNQVLYNKWIKGKSYVFRDRKKMGEGLAIDSDGRNVAIIKENMDLYYNGKKVANLGESGGFGPGAIHVKDDHFAYNKGSNLGARIVYDGKDIGNGVTPAIEGDHLAYSRLKSGGYSHFIYDGIDYGEKIGQGSLSGNHFAFIKKYENGVARVNIDGQDYPGNFTYDTTIEISERPDCSAPNPNFLYLPKKYVPEREATNNVEPGEEKYQICRNEPVNHVCGSLPNRQDRITFQNRCTAEVDGAVNILEGKCYSDLKK